LFLLVSGVAFAQQPAAVIAGHPELFEKHVYTEGNDTLPYRLLRPAHFDSTKTYPLVIFFHGAGERGTENERQLIHASPLFTDSLNRSNYPCFVLAPQCPKGRRWAEMDWGADTGRMTPQPSVPERLTISVLTELRKSKNIDTTRIYITGLSMGGFGTWDLACRYPKWFAAIAPVCGGGDETKVGVLKKMPVWAFHGDKDKVVKTSRSINMVNALKKAGGKPKLTIYPGVQHNSWINAYAEPEFFPWLFRQHQ
jgi:predicted peptidase